MQLSTNDNLCTGANGRVSFYAFRDDKIYQTSRSDTDDNKDAHKIPSDATITVQTLLSATIYDDYEEYVALSKFYKGDQKNKSNNIIVSFERIQVSCQEKSID